METKKKKFEQMNLQKILFVIILFSFISIFLTAKKSIESQILEKVKKFPEVQV